MSIQSRDVLFVPEEDETDDCNMCGGSGFLDLDCAIECPNCAGVGQV